MTNPHEEADGRPIVQPQVRDVRASVHYLDEESRGSFWKTFQAHARIFKQHPAGYLRGLIYTLRKRSIDEGYKTSSRMQCFNMAIFLIGHLNQANGQGRAPINHLHAHFAHDPTLIAHLAHQVTGIPYSFTAHARDLFQVPEAILAERVKDASAVITCCQNNLKYLNHVAPDQQAKFNMIYHGVDLERFRPKEMRRHGDGAPGGAGTRRLGVPVTGRGGDAERERRGDAGNGPGTPGTRPLIISIGRLVEKKGFFDVLAALEIAADQNISFECQIYGDGPLRPALAQWIEAHGLSSCVTLAGSRTQAQLLAVYQSADLFILTPTEPQDGDRDGVPNVLVEAMAVALPVISTTAAGIPELVTHDLNGLLYPPGDVAGIAGGIIDLLNDREKRARLGKAARRKVVDQFDLAQAAGQLKGLFSQTSIRERERGRTSAGTGFQVRSEQ